MVFHLFYFSFYCRFFSLLLSLLFLFCSYGTAENKYLKMPQSRDGVRRVQNAADTQVRRVGVAVTSELGNSQSGREPHEFTTSRLARQLESSTSSRAIQFLPVVVFLLFFLFFFSFSLPKMYLFSIVVN